LAFIVKVILAKVGTDDLKDSLENEDVKIYFLIILFCLLTEIVPYISTLD
jgi:hypothetical protein